MSVDLVQINKKEYFKEYKDIVKTCLKEGALLPFLLEVVEVPSEYDFTDRQRENLKISEESSKLRQQEWINRQEKLGDVHYTGDMDEVNDKLNSIDNNELMSFITRFPQYQNIIK